MTRMTTLKTIGFSLAAAALIGGTASAGDGKNCKDKQHTTMMKSESNAATAVLPASAERVEQKAKTEMKVYTFDEALAKCQKYGAADLQACIDKKTGAMAKPKS